MYIPQFVLGILATLSTEFVIIMIIAVINNFKKNKRK